MAGPPNDRRVLENESGGVRRLVNYLFQAGGRNPLHGLYQNRPRIPGRPATRGT